MRVKPHYRSAAFFAALGFLAAQAVSAQPAAVPPRPKTPPAEQRPAKTETDKQPSLPAKGTALVELHDGLLHISASDADLNAVLQQIARVTGMHLQGSVGGNRVFGDYGPAAPGEVLKSLLDGVPCNFVMTQEPGTVAPQQLVISARNSGNTNAEPLAVNRTAGPQSDPAIPQEEQLRPPPEAEPAEEAPDEQPPPDAETPPPATEQPEDNAGRPNAPKTPQQFLDELNKMRQQVRPPQ